MYVRSLGKTLTSRCFEFCFFLNDFARLIFFLFNSCPFGSHIACVRFFRVRSVFLVNHEFATVVSGEKIY